MIINPALPPPDETSDVLEVSVNRKGAVVDIIEYELQAARKVAAEINAAEERWLVMYGAGSQSYWAYPLWDPGLPLVLESSSPARLVDAMRETEFKHAARRSAL